MTTCHRSVTIGKDGVYGSKCDELDVTSSGDTPREARENIRDATDRYLKNARQYGKVADSEPSLTTHDKYTS